MLKEGSMAPPFALEGIDENGKEEKFKLADILKDGKQLVLYFYPKDNTSG
jgi:peroxiredoxin Q/BCP